MNLSVLPHQSLNNQADWLFSLVMTPVLGEGKTEIKSTELSLKTDLVLHLACGRGVG